MAVIVPLIPGWAFWAHAVGTGLIVAGASRALVRGARTSALLLGAGLLTFTVIFQIPAAAAHFKFPAAWNNGLKELSLAGGALVVAATLPGQKATPANRALIAFGSWALVLTIAVFGVEHFVYRDFVALLVPSWIPRPMFWTYFCEAALVAAGVGILLRIKARLASGLLALMIFAWLVLLHIPRAMADPVSLHGNEWSSVFEALAFPGVAVILCRIIPE